MGKLSGKVALITGGGQGVGLGIAQAYASEGASLVLTGRHLDKLQGVVPELQARGIFRREYEGTTLRENLGLPRPENRFFPG